MCRNQTGISRAFRGCLVKVFPSEYCVFLVIDKSLWAFNKLKLAFIKRLSSFFYKPTVGIGRSAYLFLL